MKNLLRSVSPLLRSALTAKASRRSFETDERIFTEGEEAAFLPIVLSGRVKMIHFLEPGKEVIIGIFEEGEMFAVPPVFDGKDYPSTAVAMEPSELLLLSRDDFLELIRESPEFAFAVIGWMCGMLREKTSTIQNLATSAPDHRVAHILIKLAAREEAAGPIRIALRRQDIAEMAGLTTETTIRVIRRLAAKGLVQIDRGKIVIESTDGLNRLLAS
jgi:CRP/FNR family transcriptional regulator, cyclic AMP receptor protein